MPVPSAHLWCATLGRVRPRSGGPRSAPKQPGVRRSASARRPRPNRRAPAGARGQSARSGPDPEPDQARALVGAAPARDRGVWATACFAGLRRGELRALRWGDVDFGADLIRVRGSWDRKAGPIEPKSEQGRRDVPIFAALRRHLEDHRAVAADTAAGGLVFATRTGGPFDPSDVSKRAARAWAAAGVDPFTLHEGRHCFASVCVEAGINAKRLQTWMGHSSVATTFDLYGKLLDRGRGRGQGRRLPLCGTHCGTHCHG